MSLAQFKVVGKTNIGMQIHFGVDAYKLKGRVLSHAHAVNPGRDRNNDMLYSIPYPNFNPSHYNSLPEPPFST